MLICNQEIMLYVPKAQIGKKNVFLLEWYVVRDKVNGLFRETLKVLWIFVMKRSHFQQAIHMELLIKLLRYMN